MDMIFVYVGSFFGIPCGLIVGLGHSFWTIFYHHSFLYSCYGICCITGTLLTKALVTRHEDFSWIRLSILFFLSTVIISFEGSIIYLVFAGYVQMKEDEYGDFFEEIIEKAKALTINTLS